MHLIWLWLQCNEETKVQCMHLIGFCGDGWQTGSYVHRQLILCCTAATTTAINADVVWCLLASRLRWILSSLLTQLANILSEKGGQGFELRIPVIDIQHPQWIPTQHNSAKWCSSDICVSFSLACIKSSYGCNARKNLCSVRALEGY